MKEQARNHVNCKLSESGGTAKPTGAVAGEFVTETFEYDGGRQVTVYVPPKLPQAIIFAGDGQRISKWGRLLEMADVPSTMIVGVRVRFRAPTSSLAFRSRSSSRTRGRGRARCAMQVRMLS
jgi:hypothetical protein